MTSQRRIEIFSAGCAVCADAIARIRDNACPSCDIAVLDMNDEAVAAQAEELGVGSVPAVAIDGKLVDCCAGRGPDLEVLRAAGLGTALD